MRDSQRRDSAAVRVWNSASNSSSAGRASASATGIVAPQAWARFGPSSSEKNSEKPAMRSVPVSTT